MSEVDKETPDSSAINSPEIIARQLASLSPKERDALNEVVSALYFNDSSKYRSVLWSIINQDCWTWRRPRLSHLT